jgi:hypothetical protein
MRRWLEACLEGRRNSPFRCEAITNAGTRCRRIPPRGFKCCHVHVRGAERLRHEALQERNNLHVLSRGSNKFLHERARNCLATIARKRFHRAWTQDPRTPGQTIVFANPHDRERCLEWLRVNCCVNRVEDVLPETGRPPTPRCVDRMLWAAWRCIRRGGAVDEEFHAQAVKRVRIAIKDDATFWRRWDAAAASAAET